MNNGTAGLNTYNKQLSYTTRPIILRLAVVLFHGRGPFRPFNLLFNNTTTERFSPNSEYVIALQDAMNKKFSETKLKLTEMYNRYRA